MWPLKRAGRPGESEARLEGLAAIYAVVESATCATLTGKLELAGNGIEVVLLIVGLDPRRVRFIAQTESQGQAVGYAPSVLGEAGDRCWRFVPNRRW